MRCIASCAAMKTMTGLLIWPLFLYNQNLLQPCAAKTMNVGKILPGIRASHKEFIDMNGLFLSSYNSNFRFGLSSTRDETSFLLVVVHTSTSRIVWTANIGSPVKDSDEFVFKNNGEVYLEKGGERVWSIVTVGKEVTSMELRDSGNLVLIGKDKKTTIWESFNYPTDTLLSNQSFSKGMRLSSNPRSNKLSYFLEFQSNDLLLYAGSSRAPQSYWSLGRDRRNIINSKGDVYSAILNSNSWKLYDKNHTLILQFIISDYNDQNTIRAATLGNDGFISFYVLDNGGSSSDKIVTIPEGSCSTPGSCDTYFVCYKDRPCTCPLDLSSYPNCKPEILSSCSTSENSMNLVSGNSLDYSALEYVSPLSIADIEGCKEACLRNCSCHVLFHKPASKSCFLFDEIGSLRFLDGNSPTTAVTSLYIKGSSKTSSKGLSETTSSGRKHFMLIAIIIVVAVLAIAGICYLGIYCYQRKKRYSATQQCFSEVQDDVLENLPGMPIRFKYQELEIATNNFSMKLGQGGFGSVYKGILQDGTQVAIKKLESIGQGKKEFQAEVSVLGTICHSHLVQIKGFCLEGDHRLLVYEYMAKGSLDKWIFMKNNEGLLLNWEKRLSIVLGTAKGLAYLHEDCYARIVHCDIKPGNVLLDDNYHAKLSDFGMAKLMTKEQSRVFTTLRGTRGYLAPEWITNQPISEKSDVFSYGILLLEIIGGRKILEPLKDQEKVYLPLYAFQMMKEGKIREVIDPMLDVNAEDETVVNAIKVALWCIQQNMHERPSMSQVVQMLEGVLDVPQLLGSSRGACQFTLATSEQILMTMTPSQKPHQKLRAIHLFQLIGCLVQGNEIYMIYIIGSL
ncbi:hypothetical protein Sjap_019270 [Stephania japonica]|uniref:Receptor-like serine/threonine-protein kinase n=1 Tax=Stephania japonica TaxID=461633 RepID=A0AAP0HZ68_9MAGN